MPFLAALLVILTFMSMMQSYPQLWWWLFGAISSVLLWLYLDAKWQRHQLRREHEHEIASRIHDEEVRMQVAEQALKNAYAGTQTRIRSVKRKR